MANITIRQVAEEAKVSIASVSRVLNGCTNYKQGSATQLRVREAAERLGYQPHAAARLLRQPDRNLVGLVVRLSVFAHANSLLIAVRDELVRHNLEPVLFEPEQLLPGHGRRPFPSLDMLAGILSLDLTLEQETPDFYRSLQRSLPVIAVYPVEPGRVESVCMDNARGIELAVAHLAAFGHRRIAFAAFPQSSNPSDRTKLLGWEKALRAIHLDRKSCRLINISEGTEHIDLRSIGASIVTVVEQMRVRPTALICTSDEIALSAMAHLLARGTKLPQDLSVVGFDGIDFGNYSYPSLTTILQPSAAVAHAAVARLLALKKRGANAPKRRFRQHLIEPSILLRDSTSRLNG